MKKIMIDMDGVLCDYKTHYEFIKNTYTDIQYPQSLIGFYTRLKPIENAIKSLYELENSGKYKCYILTRHSIKNINCLTEKAEWLRYHFGEWILKRLIISFDKSLIIGDYLIDDMTEHGQCDFIGEHLHFGKNKKFENWDEILNYLL